MQKFNNVSLRDIQEHTRETYQELHDLSHLANCVGGESGEFQNIVKKIKRAEFDPKFEKANGMSIKDLKKRAGLELIDEIYYCAESANQLGLDLEFLWKIKIDMNNYKYGRKKFLDPLTEDYLKLEIELPET
jgi:hypothetical protein